KPGGRTGAATLELARRKVRHNALVTTEPHNVAFQFLAETGIVGLLLGGVAAIAGVGAAVEAVRRARSPAVAALAIAVAAYLVHALEDIDWDFVAVTGPAFLVAGVLAGSIREPRRRGVWPGAVALLVLAGAVSIPFPWLAGRKVDAAYEAIGRGQFARAAS